MDTERFKVGWILVAFDLPVLSKKQRKAATGFRQWLLDDGFHMLQFSVYARRPGCRRLRGLYDQSGR